MNTRRRRRIRTGFTLIEMMAVVAVIMILAALLLSVIGKTRARGIRMQCLNNIKQVDILLLMYGHENSDRLPQTTYLIYLPLPLVQMAMRDRIPHQVFYDPGRDDQSDNWFKVNDIRQIGYCLTLPANTFYLGTNVNPTIIPQPISRGLNILLPPPNASERALVAGGTWMPAFSSYPNAHVDSKDYPLGDNVAMLDGSAKWRKFKDMIPRQVTDSGVDILGARW